MRTFRTAVVLTSLLLVGSTGCKSHEQPSTDAIKSVRVLESPDPDTLLIFGEVQASRIVTPEDWRNREELTIDALKAAALRRYPDTTLLIEVKVNSGHSESVMRASGIAARRKGS